MPRFADLKDESIEIIDQHRSLILRLIDELFEDKVIGRKEWTIVDGDTYIGLYRTRLAKKEDNYLVISAEKSDDGKVSYFRFRGMYLGYSQDCYTDEDDLVIGLRRVFSRRKLDERTQYEKDKEEAKLRSNEEEKRLFIKEFGHLLDAERIEEIVRGLDYGWKQASSSLNEIVYNCTRSFRTEKLTPSDVDVDMTLSFSVYKTEGTLSVHLKCEYGSTQTVGARTENFSAGSESWSASVDDLDALADGVNGLMAQVKQFERERF